MLTVEAQGSVIPDPSLPDALVCNTCEAMADRSSQEVVRYIYVVLLQEEAINKMKRKTETTEDPVEVNYVTKKVKMSSDKCIILFN